MKISLSQDELLQYISTQINTYMPDNKRIDEHLKMCLQDALFRTEECFKKIIIPYYRINEEVVFNHFNSDQYAMFLYILSNEVWKRYGNFEVASKLMYLNKIMHSMNCMYEVELPEHFAFYHTVGTVIGKSGKYSDYIVFCHGVTVGMQGNKGTEIGERVSFLPHSSVVGNSKIGNGASIGIRSCIYNTNVPENHIAITDEKGILQIKKAKECFNKTIFDYYA